MAIRQLTNVAKLVEEKQEKLAGKITRILKKAAKRVSDKIVEQYEAKGLAKADESEKLIRSILDSLELSDVSVDIVDSITPELMRAYKKAGLFGVQQVGIEVEKSITEQMDQLALDYMDERGAELIEGLTETTEKGLGRVLNEAVTEGYSTKQLADAIFAMGEFDEARSNTIARTELATAHVQGNIAGWRETGLVKGKQAILGDLHEKEDECDECADAGIVGLDEEFIPGYSFAPFHPNCVCDILPVLEYEGSEEEATDEEGEDENED